ncbi:MAG TPA: GNAT family N-acetyltransferase [Oceanospirillales bacterium]|nr:GNAT family N-acetyltransferase [Oceanospirillales bacterium]
MLNSKQVYLKSFAQLSKTELYAILALRVQIFCVEQNCPYQDLDGQDQDARHVFIKTAAEIGAYARIIDENENTAHIGRVVVNERFRRKGLAKVIMNACIMTVRQGQAREIEVSAQSYLNDFYQELGFKNTGKYYLEDDIPHAQMRLSLA